MSTAINLDELQSPPSYESDRGEPARRYFSVKKVTLVTATVCALVITAVVIGLAIWPSRNDESGTSETSPVTRWTSATTLSVVGLLFFLPRMNAEYALSWTNEMMKAVRKLLSLGGYRFHMTDVLMKFKCPLARRRHS